MRELVGGRAEKSLIFVVEGVLAGRGRTGRETEGGERRRSSRLIALEIIQKAN